MSRIMLPEWVYKVLRTRKNVALPNACNDLDPKSLKKHLETKIGEKIKLRKAIHLCEYRLSNGRKESVEKTYLIAEVRYGKLEISGN